MRYTRFLARLLVGSVAALLVAALCSSTSAEVPVDKSSVVLNRHPGMCTWCALETAGRHLRIARLSGLADQMKESAKRDNKAMKSDAIDELERRRVRYDVQWPVQDEPWYKVSVESGGHWYVGRFYRTKKAADSRATSYRQKFASVSVTRVLLHRTRIIESACRDGLGVAVSIDPVPPSVERHIVLMTHFNAASDEVRYIDSNVDNKNSQTRSLTWFLRRYNGFAIVIFPEVLRRRPTLPPWRGLE